MSKAIWQCSSPEQKTILITLLMMVNHEEKQWIWRGEKYTCNPGQFITSLKSIAQNSGTSIQNVRTALKNFEEKYDFLTNESTKQSRLITITNWDTYQATSQQANNKSNKRVTNDQQTGNNQLTTNKNDKEEKNERKRILRYEDFLQFYSEYPVKKSKQQAIAHWNKWEKAGELPRIEVILAAVRNQTAERIRKKNTRQFVPEWKHPSTWLNSKAWEDVTEDTAEDIENRLDESGYDPVTKRYMTPDGQPRVVL